MDNQRVNCKERSDEETKNTEKHNTISTQKCADIEGDAKGQQDKSSKDMSGQKKEKDKRRGLGTEDEKRSKEEKGSQTGENGSSLVISDWESLPSKSSSDTSPSALVGVDGVEDRFYAKEKLKGTALPEDGCVDGGKDRGVNTHVEMEVNPDSCSLIISKEISRSVGPEVEEECEDCVGRREGT